MNKTFLLLCLLLCGTSLLKAQYPLVTIPQIQTISGASLGACQDSSTYVGDTIRVRGVVVMNGGLAQTLGGREVWIQSANGTVPFSGLDVRGSSTVASSPDDLLNLIAGDSIEITGRILEYQGETEIDLLTTGTNCTILFNVQADTQATVVTINQLNDNAQNNNLVTGEQFEGEYIEVQTVTVTAVTYFGTGSTRVSFTIQDASGSIMNVSDRFLAQRTAANGGTFVPPTIGDQYCAIRGVLMHSKNNCPGVNYRGYELHPFKTADYVVCSAAPSIFNISRNYVTPTALQNVTVTAQITDGDGVASANLYYATGISPSAYTMVPMVHGTGNSWSADIPAQSNGTFVKYYVTATDSLTNVGYNPHVPAPTSADPKFYTVRDNGTTIYDLQFVPTTFSNGTSGYQGLDVTVTGVVTASAEPNNLGYVFMQQENQLNWAGIMCTGSSTLSTLTVGQKVTMTGTVSEYFGFTQLTAISSIALAGTGAITPLLVNPDSFTTYGFASNESYESMLLKVAPPSGTMYVVDQNADGPPSNFGEYRVGSNQFDPATGCRIIAGRQTSTTYSSLNVSYVNDSSWMTTDGQMNVPPCIVHTTNTFDSIIGIMYYGFSNMKLLPRNNSDFYGNIAWCTGTATDPDVSGARFAAYPNPVSGSLSVDYQLTSGNSSATLNLLDLTGRIVRVVELNQHAGLVKLDVSTLPAGAYLMSAQDGQSVLYRNRIIITK